MADLDHIVLGRWRQRLPAGEAVGRLYAVEPLQLERLGFGVRFR
jgi:hypothetical protein